MQPIRNQKNLCLISDNSLIVASVSDYYVKIFCVQKTLNLGHVLFLWKSKIASFLVTKSPRRLKDW